MHRLLLALALLLPPAFPAGAQSTPDGDWLTAGASAMVRVSRCAPPAEAICGHIVWLWESRRADGTAMRDEHNGDPALRARPLVGLAMLNGFQPGAAGEWTGGRIYNPEDGNTYSATLKLRDATTMEVRGCVLFVCRSQLWRRPSALPR